MRIHKYMAAVERPSDEVFTVEMPEGAVPLSCDIQDSNGRVVIWAVVDLEAQMVPTEFYIVATGEDLREGLGSSLVLMGRVGFGSLSYVYHVFKIKK